MLSLFDPPLILSTICEITCPPLISFFIVGAIFANFCARLALPRVSAGSEETVNAPLVATPPASPADTNPVPILS